MLLMSRTLFHIMFAIVASLTVSSNLGMNTFALICKLGTVNLGNEWLVLMMFLALRNARHPPQCFICLPGSSRSAVI